MLPRCSVLPDKHLRSNPEALWEHFGSKIPDIPKRGPAEIREVVRQEDLIRFDRLVFGRKGNLFDLLLHTGAGAAGEPRAETLRLADLVYWTDVLEAPDPAGEAARGCFLVGM